MRALLTRHPRLLFLLLSAALLLALYARTLASPFVYDDLEQILNNPDLATWHTFAPHFLLHPVDLSGIFLGHPGSTFRPLFWLSLFFDRALYGVAPAGYHATDLALHLLNANLLFALLLGVFSPRPEAPPAPATPEAGRTRASTAQPSSTLARRRRRRASSSTPPRGLSALFLAAITALLWLALPVNTEVVAWVSARAYLLSTALILTALLALAAHRRRPSPATLLLAVFAALAAPLAHELGLLILPLALLLHPDRPTLRRNRLPLALIALADAAILLLRHHLAVHPSAGRNSPLVALQSLGEYLSLALLPLHLSVERSTTLLPNHPYPALLALAATFLTTLLLTLTRALHLAAGRRQPTENPGAPHLPQEMWVRRKATQSPDRQPHAPTTRPPHSPEKPALPKAIATGLLWFLLAIAPFCLFANYQGLAERFAYLATIGLCLALAAAALAPPIPHLRHATLAALTLWFTWNLYRTTTRVADWSDPVRLYTASLLANPNSPSLHYDLAFSLRERGDLDQALHEYQTTLTLDRTHPHAYASLGDTYLDLHAYVAALAAYRQALRQTPNDAAVLLNVATAYAESGDPTAAEATYRRVLALDPKSSAVHVDLGVLLQGQNRPNEAAHQFAQAIDLKSTDPVPYYNLAVLFQRAGRPDLALPLYKKTLQLRPNDPDTLHNLQQLHPTP